MFVLVAARRGGSSTSSSPCTLRSEATSSSSTGFRGSVGEHVARDPKPTLQCSWFLDLVSPTGFEPVAFAVSRQRSTAELRGRLFLQPITENQPVEKDPVVPFSVFLVGHQPAILTATDVQVRDHLYSKSGGPGRDRTDDPRHAMAVLSQLSYRPVRTDSSMFGADWWYRTTLFCSSGRR
jgi:hypothetical protein